MRKALWLALAGLVMFSGAALAQTGTIVGTVVDGQGAAVANARVMVVVDGGMCGPSVYTDDQGQYTFTDIEVGTYAIRASKMMVGMGTITGVEVLDGQITEAPPIVLGSGCPGHGGKNQTQQGGGGL